MPNNLYEDFDVTQHIAATDIGGTNANGAAWIDLGLHNGECLFLCGTAADYTDATAVCQLYQATTSAGGSAKVVTALAQTIVAASNTARIRVERGDLDEDGDFGFVRMRITEGSNGGNNYVHCTAIAGPSAYKHAGLSSATLTDT